MADAGNMTSSNECIDLTFICRGAEVYGMFRSMAVNQHNGLLAESQNAHNDIGAVINVKLQDKFIGRSFLLLSESQKMDQMHSWAKFYTTQISVNAVAVLLMYSGDWWFLGKMQFVQWQWVRPYQPDLISVNDLFLWFIPCHNQSSVLIITNREIALQKKWISASSISAKQNKQSWVFFSYNRFKLSWRSMFRFLKTCENQSFVMALISHPNFKSPSTRLCSHCLCRQAGSLTVNVKPKMTFLMEALNKERRREI